MFISLPYEIIHFSHPTAYLSECKRACLGDILKTVQHLQSAARQIWDLSQKSSSILVATQRNAPNHDDPFATRPARAHLRGDIEVHQVRDPRQT